MASIDYSTFTMGEIAKIEELSGVPFTALADDTQPKGNAFAAIAFIVKRREDKAFTWNQAQSMTLGEITEIIGDDEADDPKADDSTPTD